MPWTTNPQLETLEHDDKRLAIDKKWRFFHPVLSYKPTLKILLNWRKGRRKLKKEKEKDTFTLPLSDPADFFSSTRNGISRISHASFFIRLDGIIYLTDPVYYKLPLVRTISSISKIFSKLPHVDYILLSHDHRDHFDVRTLKKLRKLFPDIKILTGLGMRPILEKLHFSRIQTAWWFQKYNTPKGNVYFLPARHWAKRTFFDTNKRLWGSFILQSWEKTIFFWWDSGYESHFKEIGILFPEIDYAFVWIWWYEAKWFVHPNHTNPEEALDAIKDLWAKYLVPMHYGSFALSKEPPNQPLMFLKRGCEKRNCFDKVKILWLWETITWE